MSGPPSSNSGFSDICRLSAADAHERRGRILSELDIDVWELRVASEAVPAVPLAEVPTKTVPGSSMQDSAEQAVGLASPERAAPRGSGPAAAMALLADALPGSGATTQAPSPPATEASDPGLETPPLQASEPASDPHAEAPLDLWCLSGAQGVLLANFAGLSAPDQRFLNDVFQAASRLLAAAQVSDQEAGAKGPGKLKVLQLRFSWPPLEQAAGAMPADATAPVSRALRGFLSRQLQGKRNPVILLAADALQGRLADIDLGVPAERRVYIGEPGELVGNGAAKRALWATLNKL